MNNNNDNDEGCVRCGSDLNDVGFCTDETCPFDTYNQADPRGFASHPDFDIIDGALVDARRSTTVRAGIHAEEGSDD